MVPERITELAATKQWGPSTTPGNGAVIPEQGTLANAVAMDHHTVPNAHVVFDNQTVSVDHGALLDVDMVSYDYGGRSVTAYRDARPDAGKLSNLHVADHVCELADPSGVGNLGRVIP